MAPTTQMDKPMPMPARDRSHDVTRIVRDLVTSGSLEMGAHRPADAAAIAELLPSGTPVYVNHLPRHTLDQTLEGLVAVRAAGLEPVPHLAARRVASRQEAQTFLREAVRHAGVRKVLLIGGDAASAVGPYNDAASLLRDGLIAEAGLREVAFAAYPEGHPRIPISALQTALEAKLQTARVQGLGCSIITQFSFQPSRIIEFLVGFERRAPDVPVYVGLAGPTSPLTLMKFAHACGVSASLRALAAQGIGAARLVTHTDPGEQLAALARHMQNQASSSIVGAHFFSFGGAVAVARWMNVAIRGAA